MDSAYTNVVALRSIDQHAYVTERLRRVRVKDGLQRVRDEVERFMGAMAIITGELDGEGVTGIGAAFDFGMDGIMQEIETAEAQAMTTSTTRIINAT